MRAVVQRVSEARVDVVGSGGVVETVGGFVGEGLLVLLGVTHGDSEVEAAWLSAKIAGLRLLRGERSVLEADAPVLVVSQFTLYGDARKGRRPTWSAAAGGDVAEPLYERFCVLLGDQGLAVHRGRFGADMAVHLVNDGPVTLILETPTVTAASATPGV